MFTCIGGLAALLFLAVSILARKAYGIIRRKLNGRQMVVFGALACVAVFAAQKQVTIEYPRTDPNVRYLTDKGSKVVETNGTVIAHINYEKLNIVPNDAQYFLDARPQGSTNDAEWVNIATWRTDVEPFTQMPLEFNITGDWVTADNWTNLQYVCYTDWSPGPAVVTNGVWHASAHYDIETGEHIVPKNAAMVVGVLPPGYQRCEYIEGRVGPWISTGVYPNHHWLEMHVAGDFYNDNFFFETARGGYGFRFSEWRSSINGVPSYYDSGNNITYTITGHPFVYDKHILYNKAPGYGAYLNGVMVANDGNVNRYAYEIRLWNRTSAVGQAGMSAFKMFFCQIGDNLTGELVRDYIPALDPNGKPCLFDLVTKQPYYNLGTGEFLYKLKGANQ